MILENSLKTALKLRFEYYNLYENRENEWHKKYKNHYLYKVIVESFKYDFKEIAKIMPKLLNDFEKKL